MTTFTIGRQAEAVAANYLEQAGYRIMQQNFRTRWCEIDIIAEKSDVLYFVEVKYRHSDAQGGGLEYITARKLRQMGFAASFWLAGQNRPGIEYRLAGIEVSGENLTVTEFIDSLT